MTTPLRALHGLCVVGALTALVGCASVGTPGSGPAAETPVFHVGDRWIYRAVEGFRVKTEWDETREVIAMGAEGITVRITQKGPDTNVTRTELWSMPGQVKVGSVYNNETRRFATPLQRYDFPLTDGKAWNQWVENYNEFTKKSGQINRYVRVRGWDKVTTAAGSFDAVSMQVIMRLDDDEFWRWGTDCNYAVWYSPAVRGVVRALLDAQYREKDGSVDGGGTVRTLYEMLELVSFTPGGT
jgi:hypothetical protein